MPLSVSVVVPVLNEEENVARMHAELAAALDPTGRDYELIFVDDGSRDATLPRLKEIAAGDERVKVLSFRRNFGQSAAMHAGIQHATGDVVVTLDGDLQNDPADIPAMVAKIDEGYDLVHGWRRERQDTWLDRRLPSQIANGLIAWLTGHPVHDLGCTLKAIRREVAQEIELYGEMHRFIAVLAHARGARICEVETHHRARQFGETKYGISRTLRVVLDLLTIKYLIDFSASPMKFFGYTAMLLSAASVVAGCAAAVCGWCGATAWALGLGLGAAGGLFSSLHLLGYGLLAETNARLYFQGDRQPWAIRERVNFEVQADENEHTEPWPRRRAA